MQDQGLYLEHFGVLGMKWGRRKHDQNAKGPGGPTKRKLVDAVRKGQAKNKKRRELANAAEKKAREVLGNRYEGTKLMLGTRGVNGVATRMTEKGMTWKKAYRREFGKQVAQMVLLNAGAAVVGTAVGTGLRKLADKQVFNDYAQAQMRRKASQDEGKRRANVFLKQLGDAKMSENRVWLSREDYKVG